MTGRSIPQEGLDLVTVGSYEIETTIERNLSLVGRATAQLRRNQGSYTWVPFRLFSELEVDSIRSRNPLPAHLPHAGPLRVEHRRYPPERNHRERGHDHGMGGPTVRMVTFNLGEFESYDSQVANAPGLTVYIDERAHHRLGGLVAERGGILLSQEDMAQNVA